MNEPNARIEYEELAYEYERVTGYPPPVDWSAYDIETAIRERGMDL